MLSRVARNRSRSAHDTTTLARYVPDLAKDKVHCWLTKYHWVSNVVVAVLV